MNTIISNNATDKQFNFTINRFLKTTKLDPYLTNVIFPRKKDFLVLRYFNIFLCLFLLVKSI